jgi:hypothetical protein
MTTGPTLRAQTARMFERAGCALVAAIVAAVGACLPASAATHARPPTFVVDAVHVTAAGADFAGMVLPASPGDATQETTIVDRTHHRTLSVIAVPFGTRPGTEDAVSTARRGGAASYRSALHDYRASRGEYASDAPSVLLFGNRVPGDMSQRTEHFASAGGRDVDREVFTAEWVTEAGPRLWIVRARQFAPASHPLGAIADFANSVEGLTLWSDGSIAAPTTVSLDVQTGLTASYAALASAATPKRAWPATYSGACDEENYDRATGRHDWRNKLGGTFSGVPACGPRPAPGAPAIAASFAPIAPSGVLQFDAVELSLRWMYLAYGTPPFAGNGDELIANYDPANGGQPLFRYANLAGSGNQPRPGDVLSYDTGGTGGHTAVVQSAHADSHGNGWVDVIEQNASPHGVARLAMIDDQVLSNYGGAVMGWLSPRPYR